MGQEGGVIAAGLFEGVGQDGQVVEGRLLVARPGQGDQTGCPPGRVESQGVEGEAAEEMAEERRQENFRALVDAHDQEMTVPQSRTAVAQRFGVSESQVRKIEREGLDNNWPPL